MRSSQLFKKIDLSEDQTNRILRETKSVGTVLIREQEQLEYKISQWKNILEVSLNKLKPYSTQ